MGENSLFCIQKIMQQLKKISALLLVAICLLLASCSSSKKAGCGCPNKQGMVGYK